MILRQTTRQAATWAGEWIKVFKSQNLRLKACLSAQVDLINMLLALVVEMIQREPIKNLFTNIVGLFHKED